MKRYILTILWISGLNAGQMNIPVQAESAILMNADTGVILYEKSAHSSMYPASTTKIATALWTLKFNGQQLQKKLRVDKECVVSLSEESRRKANYSQPAFWLETDGCHIGLRKDEEMTLKDLLNGMLISSGNDAANVIAHHNGSGSIPKFMDTLNAYLKELGCTHTHFCNPHGLHHPKHVTTAYDLAVMTREALKNPVFCEIVKSKHYTRPKTNKQESAVMVQTNRLVRKGQYHYPKAIGVKTGHHSNAGHALVSAAREGDRTLIAVLLKSKERTDLWTDSVKLFETAFNQPKVEKVLLKKGQQKFTLQLEGAENSLTTYTEEDLALAYYPAEEPKVKALLSWEANLQVPLAKNQKVGKVELTEHNGKILKTIPLLAHQDVEPTWAYRLKTNATNQPLYVKLIAIFSLLTLTGFFILRSKR